MKKTILLIVGLALCAGVVYAGMAIRKFNVVDKSTVILTTSASANASTANYVIPIVGGIEGMKGGIIKVVVGASPTTLRGAGLSDTCTIAIRSYFDDGTWLMLDSTKYTAIPCSTMIARSAVSYDTLFRGSLRAWIRVADTCSDSVQTFLPYPVKAYGYLRD